MFLPTHSALSGALTACFVGLKQKFGRDHSKSRRSSRVAATLVVDGTLESVYRNRYRPPPVHEAKAFGEGCVLNEAACDKRSELGLRRLLSERIAVVSNPIIRQ